MHENHRNRKDDSTDYRDDSTDHQFIWRFIQLIIAKNVRCFQLVFFKNYLLWFVLLRSKQQIRAHTIAAIFVVYTVHCTRTIDSSGDLITISQLCLLPSLVNCIREQLFASNRNYIAWNKTKILKHATLSVHILYSRQLNNFFVNFSFWG